MDFVRKSVATLNEMKEALEVLKDSRPGKEYWHTLYDIWPGLLQNELLPGTPIHPQERAGMSLEAGSIWKKTLYQHFRIPSET